MILQPMSDLHSDFPGFKGYPAPAPGAAVIVVAGDTRQGLAAALRELRAAYPPPLEVVVVAGNHEFWARPALPAAIDEGRRVAAELGLHYLENQVAVIGGATGVRFAGCTLWSDYGLFGEASRAAAMRAALEVMRDHKRIKWQSKSLGALPPAGGAYVAPDVPVVSRRRSRDASRRPDRRGDSLRADDRRSVAAASRGPSGRVGLHRAHPADRSLPAGRLDLGPHALRLPPAPRPHTDALEPPRLPGRASRVRSPSHHRGLDDERDDENSACLGRL